MIKYKYCTETRLKTKTVQTIHRGDDMTSLRLQPKLVIHLRKTDDFDTVYDEFEAKFKKIIEEQQEVIEEREGAEVELEGGEEEEVAS